MFQILSIEMSKCQKGGGQMYTSGKISSKRLNHLSAIISLCPGNTSKNKTVTYFPLSLVLLVWTFDTVIAKLITTQTRNATVLYCSAHNHTKYHFAIPNFFGS